MSEYKVNIDTVEIGISEADAKNLDVIETPKGNLHVLHGHTAYDVVIVNKDWIKKEFTIRVNGTNYTLTIHDAYDQMVKKMGLLEAQSQKISDIKAPMPGLIVDVLVQAGDVIEEGSQLVVLSAMKMENIIMAPGSGTVKSVEVSKDDAVDKGQLLIIIE